MIYIETTREGGERIIRKDKNGVITDEVYRLPKEGYKCSYSYGQAGWTISGKFIK